MIKALFEKMQQHLAYFFKTIDMARVEALLQIIAKCEGSLIFTGVGKSGIIAQKMAVTFISTGTKAFYLSPLDSLHGDLGIVSSKDIFIFLSKSGQTAELLALLPHVKKKGAFTVGLVSSSDSLLGRECDFQLKLPVEKELCPFNLVPTTSTSVQLIFGDILAVALMQHKKISIDDYALNHPAGAIGKKISLKVEDLMFKGESMPLCRSNDLLIDLLHLLSSKKCGSLIVVDEKGNLEGIFTDGDLRRSIANHGEKLLKRKIGELMTVSPKCITKDILAVEALKKMEEGPLVTVLPVVEQKRVVGLIRLHDIIQAGIKE